MIYSYNTLGFYETKGNRQYDNTGNFRVLHHFETNKIPALQVVIDSTITTATYRLLDIDDTEISTGNFSVENATTEEGTSYSRLIFLGATLTGKSDGFYYLEITYDSNKLYSDAFCWQTDVSDYLKISATTKNMNIGGFELNLSGFTYLVYLEAKNFTEEFEIEEEGVQKTNGNIPLYNSRNHTNEYDITGYRKTYNFLAGLRTISTNGTVAITFAGENNEIYDIEVPEKKSNYGNTDIIILGLKFKLKDYLQVRNEV